MKTLSAMVLAVILLPSVASAATVGQTIVSQADRDQIMGDIKIIAKYGPIVKDEDPDAKAARLAKCVAYWDENLHRNRSAEARRLVLAARVARCMHVTGYTVAQASKSGRCKWAWGGPPAEVQIAGFMMQAKCYAKFAQAE